MAAALPGSAAAAIQLDDDDDDDAQLVPARSERARGKRRRHERSRPKENSVVLSLDSDDDEAPPAAEARRHSSGGSGSSSGSAPSAAPTTEWTRPSGEITCPICFCETEADEAAVLASCSHAFCVECLSQYVQAKVTAGEVLSEQLACPCVEPKRCAVPLVPQDVRRCLVSEHDRERYERLSFNRCIEAEDDLGSCPTAGCPFAFVWDPHNRKLDCPLCKKSFCLVCRSEPWHQGKRCEEFQAERGDPEASDAAFANFAKSQKLRQCPKCKFWVEKTSGCDAMHCRCNLVFCYKCGGVLKKTAKANGLNECSCGQQDQANLAAHEAPGVANHNRPDQMRANGGRDRAAMHAAMVAAQQAHMQQAAQQGGRGGWRAPPGFMGMLMRQAMMFAGDDDEEEDDDYGEGDDW